MLVMNSRREKNRHHFVTLVTLGFGLTLSYVMSHSEMADKHQAFYVLFLTFVVVLCLTRVILTELGVRRKTSFVPKRISYYLDSLRKH